MFLLDKIWWNGLSPIVAIELPQGEEQGKFLWVRKKKGAMEIVSSGRFSTAEELARQIQNSKQAGLLINLSPKEIPHGFWTPESATEPVSALLGVSVDNPRDFSMMSIPAWEEKEWMAVIRNSMLDEIHSWIEKAQERLMSVVFHPGAFLFLVPALLSEQSSGNVEVRKSGEVFYLREGLPASAEDMNGINFEEIDASEIAERSGIPEAFLDLAGSILFAWNGGASEGLAATRLVGTIRENRKVSRLKNIVGVGAGVLLTIAVGMTVYRMSLNSRQKSLAQVYQSHLPQIEQLETLNQKIESKMELRANLSGGSLGVSKASFYYDRIGRVIPLAVSLEEMVFRPEEEDLRRVGLRDEKKVDLFISGKCPESLPVAELNEKLAGLDWVAEVRLLRSDYDFREDSYQFLFVLEVTDAG